MEPYELIAHPLELWLAPVGEAFPAVDEVPGGNWAKVGTSGDLDYEEDGVSVQHEQTVEVWRGAGSTGPRKAYRTEEGLIIGVTLADMSPEQYATALNFNSVTEQAAGAGQEGYKVVPLYRGLTVVTRALLARGISPIDETLTAQYEIPVCFEAASPELSWSKGDVTAYELEFMALEDPNAASEEERFGHWRAQTAAAQ